jgi:hypothetical protein
MDSAAAKAIANQKVFVTLASVLDVQTNFNRLVNQTMEHAGDTPSSAMTKNHARGMAQVIRALGLPIVIPNGF